MPDDTASRYTRVTDETISYVMVIENAQPYHILLRLNNLKDNYPAIRKGSILLVIYNVAF